MNKAVQILLIVAVLVPLAGFAREETMEERKLRITRKYMRENATVTQSDMIVPLDVLPEDEQLTDSERFRETEIDIARHEGGAPMPLPPRRPVARTENRNWLLDVEPLEEDLADAPERAEDYWKSWGKPEEKSATSRSSSYDRTDSSGYDSRRQGSFNPRDPQADQFGTSRQDSRSTGGLFGRQQPEETTSGGFSLSRPRTYDTTPESGLLQTPFVRRDGSGTDRSDTDAGRRGYTPYERPDTNTRQTPASRQWGTSAQPPKEQYQRSDPYQKWKENNKQWDPTADDSSIDDIMKRNDRR